MRVRRSRATYNLCDGGSATDQDSDPDQDDRDDQERHHRQPTDLNAGQGEDPDQDAGEDRDLPERALEAPPGSTCTPRCQHRRPRTRRREADVQRKDLRLAAHRAPAAKKSDATLKRRYRCQTEIAVTGTTTMGRTRVAWGSAPEEYTVFTPRENKDTKRERHHQLLAERPWFLFLERIQEDLALYSDQFGSLRGAPRGDPRCLPSLGHATSPSVGQSHDPRHHPDVRSAGTPKSSTDRVGCPSVRGTRHGPLGGGVVGDIRPHQSPRSGLHGRSIRCRHLRPRWAPASR